MTTNPHNPNTSETGEDTLRLIASLPAPTGLEDRVRAAMKSSQPSSRVLTWPTRLRPQSGWIRTAAAAAIVFVVAGGGWGVYTRVPQGHSAKVIVTPSAVSAGGFSSAGAMRTPQTLPGPAAPADAGPKTAQLKPSPHSAAKKPVAAKNRHVAASRSSVPQ